MTQPIQLGLRQNWKQFSLLVLVNAFVGGMVGLERSIFPTLAETEFGVDGKTAILSFIVVFGITKAAANYFMGKMAGKIGRKQLLVLGWLFGLPVPFILMYAPSWNWVIFANFFLGINQGLAWSSTVIMKIDLVGDKDRGLAMGINEFAGYLAVGITAFFTGWLASEYGLRPYPFYIGIGLAVFGLLTSIFFIKDTHKYVAAESTESSIPLLKNVFRDTTLLHPNLGSVTQAGLINNLNDGMVWGLLPIFFTGKGFGIEQVAVIAGIYPGVWGIGQLFTGKMADHFSHKRLLFWGMLIQAFALFGLIYSQYYWSDILAAVLLGWGTAMVYPTFLTAIAAETHPRQRAESIGVFRLWRDLGYAIGALLTGIIADYFGVSGAIATVGGLTLLSAFIIQIRMKKRY